MKTIQTLSVLLTFTLVLWSCSSTPAPLDPSTPSLSFPINEETCLEGTSINDSQSSLEFRWNACNWRSSKSYWRRVSSTNSMLNLIPYIGPLIAAILMIVLSMTSNITADFSTVILPKSIYVLIGFVIGQLIDNFLSQPFIFSNSVKSHPLEIFIVILLAGLLFGTTGLIFAIPMYTALKVIFKEFFAQYEIVQSLTKDL